MKILSKYNVEKEILLFWRKNPVLVKNLEVKLSFVLYKCLRNIWMVPFDDQENRMDSFWPECDRVSPPPGKELTTVKYQI